MDPNATLKCIEEFIRDKCEGYEVDDWCQDLYEWIGKGGFEPRWANYELGTGYYRCRAIEMGREKK